MKNPKGFIPVAVALIVVVVAALIAGGSYYYTKSLNKNTNTVTNTNVAVVNENTNAIVNTNTTVVNGNTNTVVNTNGNLNTNTVVNSNTNTDTTSGWKTYASTKYGFSLKYPLTMRVLEVNETSGIILRVGVEGSANGDNVLVYNKSSNTGIPYSTVKSESGKAFVISHVGVEADQILSTFTFLDETAGWKTYTNSEYGWTMKYPTNWAVNYSYQTTDPYDTFETPIRTTTFTNPNKYYRLLVGMKKKTDVGSIVPRTGIGAGEFIKGDTVLIGSTSMTLWNLVYNNLTSEIFNYNPTTASNFEIGNFQFIAYFDCGTATTVETVKRCNQTNLSAIPEYKTIKLILGSLILPK
ncbi:hypothetical protein C4546_01380 [Candidatus Parcubacteria bacterium]|jgi:hypothetical protein|nr:MAG: hypothetical protein C4546_01380 [Candidatus Parcubacteria bacterium]